MNPALVLTGSQLLVSESIRTCDWTCGSSAAVFWSSGSKKDSNNDQNDLSVVFCGGGVEEGPLLHTNCPHSAEPGRGWCCQLSEPSHGSALSSGSVHVEQQVEGEGYITLTPPQAQQTELWGASSSLLLILCHLMNRMFVRLVLHSSWFTGVQL